MAAIRVKSRLEVRTSSEGDKLHRSFSTFPAGLPGIGLFVLRATVGIAALTQGALYLANSGGSWLENWIIGLTLAGSGAMLLIGLLTHFAAGVLALTTIATALLSLPAPARNLFGEPLSTILVVSVAAALGLLGPGAVSFDCRLFGLREIIIPQQRHQPKG